MHFKLCWNLLFFFWEMTTDRSDNKPSTLLETCNGHITCKNAHRSHVALFICITCVPINKIQGGSKKKRVFSNVFWPWVLLQQNVICPYINNDNDVELVVVCILCYTSTEEEKKKLPIKASCCQNSRTIIISRDLEPVWKKIRFASIDRIALQSSFSIQNLFKFFTLIFFVKSFSRKFTWKSFHEKF